MASPGHRKRRNSIEEPPSIADVLEELNILHDNTSSECHEHIKKMTGLIKDFEEDYKHATRAMKGGGITAAIGATAMTTAIALAMLTAGISALVAGIGPAVAATAAGGIIVVITHFQRQQKEKKTRQNFEDHLTELQNKISPVIDVLQKLFNLTQKILRDPSISEHKANMLRERFSCFEQMQLFQIDDNREATAPISKAVHLTEDFSKFFTKMNYLLEILNEIIEDEIEDDKDKNKDTDNRPTGEKVDEKDFKKKTKTFIVEMKKEINTLQNTMNEIDQIKLRLTQRFE